MAREMLVQDDLNGVGLGFFIDERDDTVYFSHSGGNPGFSCILIASRDDDYGAAVMTNGDSGGALYGEILRSIARVYEWTDYAPVEFASFEAMVDEYRRIHAERPDDPRVAESRLNSLGYGVLGEGLTEQALSIMRLNASLYPHSANCYDSLADAYEASGDYYNALLNSRKAIAMLDRYPMENLHWQHLRETASQRIWLLEDEFVPLKEGKE
jgi:tetratricopeptide (TPR) repeat protein